MRSVIGYCSIVLCIILSLGIKVIYADVSSISGRVTDAATSAGIADATVVADPGGILSLTNDNGDYILSIASSGDYIVTAIAEGYIPVLKPITLEEGKSETLDFELVQAPPSTPVPSLSPVPTPIFTCTEPGSIELSSTRLKLKKRQNQEITVTLTCEDGSPLEGQTITAKINASGKRRISVTPNAVTDASGEATFTITAKKKTGISRLLFEAGSLKKKATVKINR